MSGQRRSARGVTQLVTPVTSVPRVTLVGHDCMCVRREDIGNGFVAAVTNEVADIDRSEAPDVGSGRRSDAGAPRSGGGDELSGQETVAAPDQSPERESRDDRRARYDSDDVTSLRERVAGTKWRRRLAARRSTNHAYRVAVGLVGGLVVAFGLATIPLPGPGWLTVIAGLFVLASEFTWAERLLEYTRERVARWTDWVGSRP